MSGIIPNIFCKVFNMFILACVSFLFHKTKHNFQNIILSGHWLRGVRPAPLPPTHVGPLLHRHRRMGHLVGGPGKVNGEGKGEFKFDLMIIFTYKFVCETGS